MGRNLNALALLTICWGLQACSNSGMSVAPSTAATAVTGAVPVNSNQSAAAIVSALIPTTGSAAGNSSKGAGGVDVTCLAEPSAPAPNAKKFYVDPVNGNDSADGSSATPWKTLNAVISGKVSTSLYGTPYLDSNNKPQANGIKPINPAGSVHSGDTIYLLNGNHGSVNVNGLNSDFITITALPGHSPVLNSLNVEGASKWIIRNLKIQSATTAPAYNILVNISLHGWIGAVDNIIFDHNSVSSIDDASTWTITDWLNKAQGHGITLNGGSNGNYANCLTVTNNAISNIRTGVAVTANHTSFAYNTIDNFADDALDYAANDIVLAHNKITNSHTLGDGNHNDGMQGQIGSGTAYSNVLIDGNMVIRQTDPNLQFSGGLQGIDAFDSDWTNVVVSNNVVVVDAYHGISFSSVHNGIFVNNTVFNDGGPAGGQMTWLAVGSTTHEGAPSTNILIRNNIVQTLQATLDPSVLTMDHNMASSRIVLLENGVVSYNSKAGVYGEQNSLIPTVTSSFKNFDQAKYSYDFRPVQGAPQVGAGVNKLVPEFDFLGAKRSLPPTIGAYN